MGYATIASRKCPLLWVDVGLSNPVIPGQRALSRSARRSTGKSDGASRLRVQPAGIFLQQAALTDARRTFKEDSLTLGQHCRDLA